MSTRTMQRTDAELLTAHAAGEAGAFGELVARHGAMVHGVCLRVLGESTAAEDASQAAFVVLAAKAKSVRGSVSAFLHGAAMNVARRQLASEAARRAREREAGEMADRGGEGREAGDRADWERVHLHLDAALEKLPTGERAAVLLHYIEQKPRTEVARELGEPEGTVAWRLARALERMRGFLERRGVSLSAATLGPVLAAGAGGEAACPTYLLAAAGKIGTAGMTGAIGAGVGALGANVSVLAKGALKMMFWAKVKMVAMVTVAATAAVTAVPVTVAVVRAAEETKRPEPVAAAPAAEPAKEEVLEFRRLTPEKNAPLPKDERFAVCRSHSDVLGLGTTWDRANYQVITGGPIDFGKEMVLAAFKGMSSGSSEYTIEKVVVLGAREVRVDIKFVQGETKDIGYPYALVACPRRDLPVVFFENGKEVARVPFEAANEAEDKELTGFLEESRYSSLVGTGVFKGITGAMPPNSHLSVTAVLFGERQAADKFGADFLDRSWALLKQHEEPAEGERVLFCVPQDELFGIVVKWSPERETAVKFALAPGWNWESARCPWHSAPGLQDQATQEAPRPCISCGRRNACASHPTCPACKMVMGECHYTACGRKVGPATRGAELLLGTLDPLRETKDIDPLSLSIVPGKAPELWTAAKLAPKTLGVRELVAEGGVAAGFRHCSTLFFWVAAEDSQAEGKVVFPVQDQNMIRNASAEPGPLRETASAKLAIASGVFAKPGTYTVRAVAGRLVSNPVTIVTTGGGTATADQPKTPEPVPLAAGPQPRWGPGGNTVEALDAASGKVLWKVTMRFPIGNVQTGPDKWVVRAQDGQQEVHLDAKTGEWTGGRAQVPQPEPAPKPGPGPEVF